MSGLSGSEAMTLSWFLSELDELTYGYIASGTVILDDGVELTISCDPSDPGLGRHYQHKVVYIPIKHE